MHTRASAICVDTSCCDVRQFGCGSGGAFLSLSEDSHPLLESFLVGFSFWVDALVCAVGCCCCGYCKLQVVGFSVVLVTCVGCVPIWKGDKNKLSTSDNDAGLSSVG